MTGGRGVHVLFRSEVVCLVVALALAGCAEGTSGPTGPEGPAGPAGRARRRRRARPRRTAG